MARRLPLYRPGVPMARLSGTALYWIGFALVCLGSLSAAILQRGILGLGAGTTLDQLAQAMKPGGDAMGWVTGAVLCALASAPAVPIYAKLLYEGFSRAAGHRRLLVRLALCALVSEIPYDLAMSGRFLDLQVQNPVWGLLLCAVTLEILQMWRFPSPVGNAVFRGLVSVAALLWGLLLRIYMGGLLLALVLLFHFARSRKWVWMLGGSLITLLHFPAPLGMVFVHWYDGEREEEPGWLFYALYPLQLLVFGAAGMLLA